MQELVQLFRNMLGEDICTRIFGMKPEEKKAETNSDVNWPRSEPGYTYAGEEDPVQKSVIAPPNYETEVQNFNAGKGFTEYQPTHDEIAARAASVNVGNDTDNWLEAERQLKAERNQ